MPNADQTIVLVSTQRRWHGGEEQARLLAVGLRDRGWRVVLLARRGGAFAKRMADEGFEVVTFAGGGRGPAAVWRMRRALRRMRPDVLHYNDSHAIDGAGVASLGLRTPLRVAARRVDFPIRSPRKYRWFCDCVLCVSNAVADTCRQGGIPGRMLRVVYDGVDPARVRAGDRARGRRSLGLADNQPLLLTVATLTEPKGHRFLLDALPTVLDESPDAILALAGDGELLATLQQQAERLNVAERVRFLGFRNDVADLIRAANLFVLPSYMEGLCSTLIDVMLAGRPIVAAAAGGIPDLLGSRACASNGQPGKACAESEDDADPAAWLVPPRDPQALARAIILAINSPERSAELQRRALRRAERLFTADRMVENTLAAYREFAPRPS